MKIMLAGAFLMFCFQGANAEVAFKFIQADDAAKMVFDPARTKEVADIASSDGFIMSLTKRIQSGLVEKHMGWDEELVIQEGDVVLNYGGDGVNAKEFKPGEWHGDSIANGKTLLMHAGDVVIIPANTWHEEVLKSPRMRYVLFKTRHGP